MCWTLKLMSYIGVGCGTSPVLGVSIYPMSIACNDNCSAIDGSIQIPDAPVSTRPEANIEFGTGCPAAFNAVARDALTPIKIGNNAPDGLIGNRRWGIGDNVPCKEMEFF